MADNTFECRCGDSDCRMVLKVKEKDNQQMHLLIHASKNEPRPMASITLDASELRALMSLIESHLRK
jgi:hypothetical protein